MSRSPTGTAGLRPPGAIAIALAILSPSILVGVIGGGLIFGLAVFNSPVDEGMSANEIALLAVAIGSIGVVPAAMALCCYTGAAIANRTPKARARWLASVHGACRPMTTGAIATWATGLLVAVMFVHATEPPTPGLIATLSLVCLLFLGASRAMNRSLRRAAVAGRWHARGLCAHCGYTISGLTRCPECGAAGRVRCEGGKGAGGPP